jgi:hypothetical protein
MSISAFTQTTHLAGVIGEVQGRAEGALVLGLTSPGGLGVGEGCLLEAPVDGDAGSLTQITLP